MNTVLPRAPQVFTAFFPTVVPGWSLVEIFKKHFNSSPAHQGMKATTLCLDHLQYLLLCVYFFYLIWVKEKEKKEANSVDEETKTAPWCWKETLSIYKRLPDTEKV